MSHRTDGRDREHGPTRRAFLGLTAAAVGWLATPATLVSAVPTGPLRGLTVWAMCAGASTGWLANRMRCAGAVVTGPLDPAWRAHVPPREVFERGLAGMVLGADLEEAGGGADIADRVSFRPGLGRVAPVEQLLRPGDTIVTNRLADSELVASVLRADPIGRRSTRPWGSASLTLARVAVERGADECERLVAELRSAGADAYPWSRGAGNAFAHGGDAFLYTTRMPPGGALEHPVVGIRVRIGSEPDRDVRLRIATRFEGAPSVRAMVEAVTADRRLPPSATPTPEV